MTTLKQENYMGVLHVRHYSSPHPVPFNGTQSDSNAVAEITLYQAAYDPVKETVIKKEPIARTRMSTAQFGEMIARPGYNDGVDCTLELVKARKVLPYCADDDHKKMDLKKKVDTLLNGHHSANSYLDSIMSLAQECSLQKRMKKSQMSDISRSLLFMAKTVEINENDQLNRVSEIAHERVSEAKSSLVGALNLPLGESQLLIADSNASCEPELLANAKLLLSTNGSSSMNLFDASNLSSSIISLTLTSECAEPLSRKERRVYEVCMTHSQYATFLRGNDSDTACTITRFMNVRSDPVSHEVTEEGRLNLSDSCEVTVNAFSRFADNMHTKLNSDGYKGVKGLKTLHDDAAELSRLYQTYLSESAPEKKDRVEHLLSGHQEKLNEYVHRQYIALPEHKRGEARLAMPNLFKYL